MSANPLNSSQYIQNLTPSYHLYYHYFGLCYYHLLPGLLQFLLNGSLCFCSCLSVVYFKHISQSDKFFMEISSCQPSACNPYNKSWNPYCDLQNFLWSALSNPSPPVNCLASSPTTLPRAYSVLTFLKKMPGSWYLRASSHSKKSLNTCQDYPLYWFFLDIFKLNLEIEGEGES